MFDWWITTISWSIAFPVIVSIYLYGRKKQPVAQKTRRRFLKDFAFVWFLIALLFFYIASISQGSYLIFIVGNVAFEVVLMAYVLTSSGYKLSKRDRRLFHFG